MQIFHSLDEFLLSELPEIALTIGNFDGLHLGHVHLLKILRDKAKQMSLPTAVLTFKQHTSLKITPDNPKIILTDTDQKSKLMQDSGLVDFLILQDFNDDFKSISAPDFVTDILVEKLKMKLIVIGQNHRFGKDRLGDLDLLQNKSQVNNFIVVPVDLLKINGKVISSSLIRDQSVSL